METFKKYAGPVLLGFGVIGLVLAIGFAFVELMKLGQSPSTVTTLPLLAIGGVIVLILMLTVVAMIFSILGLTNQGQAMGLPEGSIRAVIALSLIVLFAILAVFLYQSVSSGGELRTVQNLTDADRKQFLTEHKTERDIQAVLATDKAGVPVKAKDGSDLYTVTYRSAADPRSDDFGKQLLVLLGTLMTAVTSFYLGAGTATTAAAAAQAKPGNSPTISGINPTTHSISKNGATLQLNVQGANLNVVTHVKIVDGSGVQAIGTNVTSNANSVTCTIDLSKTPTPSGVCDVVIDDGGSVSAIRKGALTIQP